MDAHIRCLGDYATVEVVRRNRYSRLTLPCGRRVLARLLVCDQWGFGFNQARVEGLEANCVRVRYRVEGVWGSTDIVATIDVRTLDLKSIILHPGQNPLTTEFLSIARPDDRLARARVLHEVSFAASAGFTIFT